MSPRRHRRDFVLDSGALSTLAASDAALLAFLRPLSSHYEFALLIPVPVLTEVYSGNRATDVQADRLLRRMALSRGRFADLAEHTAKRAGVLRGTTSRNTALSDISAIDGQVVAVAEERSFTNAVTILTTDMEDIAALVATTARANIAVERI